MGRLIDDIVSAAIRRRQDPARFAADELKRAGRSILRHHRRKGLPARRQDHGLLIEFDKRGANTVRYAILTHDEGSAKIRCERRVRAGEDDRKDPRRADNLYFDDAPALVAWYAEAFAEAVTADA